MIVLHLLCTISASSSHRERESKTRDDVSQCGGCRQSIRVSFWDGRFGSKVGQIGPKRDKSGAFSDQISVHLAPLKFVAAILDFLAVIMD